MELANEQDHTSILQDSSGTAMARFNLLPKVTEQMQNKNI